VAAIAILVVEPASGSLLRIQSEFGIALAALHVAARHQHQENARQNESSIFPKQWREREKAERFHWFLKNQSRQNAKPDAEVQ